MRPWSYLLLLAAAQPACALAQDARYYGPMKAWHGIGFEFGYKENLQRDGSWRVIATVRSGEALDMAMYRAAELARDQGYDYVELLGGVASRSPGSNSATLYARPSRVLAQPAHCPSRRPGTCYTAIVAEVLRRLGGGGAPGVPIVDHRDEYGRAVSYSGYGLGATGPAVPIPIPVVPSVAPLPRPERSTPAMDYARALKGAQGMRGRTNQGVTISD